MTARGQKTSHAVLTAALALTSGPAMACEITLPSCVSVSNGRLSQAYINADDRDNVALFWEYDAAEDRPKTMMLIECRSRKGVAVQLGEGREDWLLPNEALDYLTEVVTSDNRYTLSQIREGLRELGTESRMTTLPAGHCGCELPKMETIGCGNG